MRNAISVAREWEHVCLSYNVPEQLHQHQLDSMSFLKQGKHVLLGTMPLKTIFLKK